MPFSAIAHTPEKWATYGLAGGSRGCAENVLEFSWLRNGVAVGLDRA